MTAAGPRVLGLIPARSGSKGIPDKNVRVLGGKPLLVHAVDAARSSKVVDRIVVTTESERIAALARAYGAEVPFLRPASLARDETPMLPVIVDAVDRLEAAGWSPEIVVLLQPTAPLRRPEHIRMGLDLLLGTRADSVVTVVPVPSHYAPHFVMRVTDGRLAPFLAEGERFTRRQDVPVAYSRDGTLYAFWRRNLREGTIYGGDCRPLILSSEESVNLDDPSDWQRAEALLARVRPS